MNVEAELSALKNIVRIGTTSSVDVGSRTARVVFTDKNNLVSGSLKVLQNQPFIPMGGVTQETEPREGGTGEKAFDKHTHEIKISPWLPFVGQTVFCLYLPNGESDGVVLGGI